MENSEPPVFPSLCKKCKQPLYWEKLCNETGKNVGKNGLVFIWTFSSLKKRDENVMKRKKRGFTQCRFSTPC